MNLTKTWRRKVRSLSIALCGNLSLAALAVPVAASDANYTTLRGIPVTEGQLRISDRDYERIEGTLPVATDRFVLQETRVDAEIAGVLARVRVEQVFSNPFSERLEAVYVFPLPEDAAVDRYWFQVGEQHIEGVVLRREEARQEYEQAREDGRKASLLEQERPNIFTQSLANLAPGEAITVHLEYAHPLKIEAERCVFRFPMVVSPRYVPGQALGRPNVGRGWAADTSQVADASRISPPAFPPGQRNGNDIFIDVRIDAGMPIQEIVAVTHELHSERPSPTEASVSLRNQSTVADRDFVLEYRLAGEDPTLAALTHRSEQNDGTFTLVLQPRWQTPVHERTPREVIFLMDTSGSMNGTPLRQARLLARELLQNLAPQDRFRIIAFSNRATAFRDDAVWADQTSIAAGQEFLRGLQAEGGTELLPALREALGRTRSEEDPVVHLVMITDALVGDDDDILGYLRRPEFAGLRVFPIAVGPGPNHYLIERAAELGRGFSMQITDQDQPQEMARRFNEKFMAPSMTDLEIDWGGLAVRDVLPHPLPDLYPGRPLVVMGHYDEPATAPITLRGNVLGQPIETQLELTLPEEELDHDCLGPLWARRQIRHIWNRDLGEETRRGKQEITELGLKYQLVTQYTSFVAVQTEASALATGPLHSQMVAALTPDGMGSSHPDAAPATASPTQAMPTRSQRPAAPPASAPRREPVRRRSSGGGGGAVEWVFLAGLSLLAAGRFSAQRREQQDS